MFCRCINPKVADARSDNRFLRDRHMPMFLLVRGWILFFFYIYCYYILYPLKKK